jgi:GTPase Era involved in 16S rRNA processing
MEPFINFKLLVDRQGEKNLQINCKHHPSEKAASGEEDITVNFSFKQIDFEAATGALQEQLAKFPQRVFHEHVLVVISGLTEKQSEQGTAKLKAEFTQHPWIKKSALKWDPEQNLLIARLIYEYQQHTLKVDARQSIKDSVSGALSFAKKESFMIYDIPA